MTTIQRQATILPDLTVDVQAELARLRAENEALKASQSAITFKVSGKGAVSAYGMGKFPVTLYADAWKRLLNKAPALLAFIEANSKLMAVKGQEPSPELKAHSAQVAKAVAARA